MLAFQGYFIATDLGVSTTASSAHFYNDQKVLDLARFFQDVLIKEQHPIS